MSYEPGTIIYASIGSPTDLSDRAVVISDGMVRIKMLNGKEHAESMKMSDFMVISRADGKTIHVVTAEQQEQQARAAVAATQEPQPAEQQQPQQWQQQQEPSYVFGSDPMPPKGSVVRWKLDDDNRITAIILHDGLHQVKAYENGAPNYQKRYYDCFANWKRHIPNFAQGTLTITPPSGPPAKVYDKPEDINPTAHFKNVELVKYLCNRWNVKSRAWLRYSQATDVQTSLNFIRGNRDSLSRITEEEDITNPSLRHRLSMQLMRNIKWYTKGKAALEMLTEEEKHAQKYEIINYYKQKLFLVLPFPSALAPADSFAQITYRDDKIIFNGKAYNTFEEIGIQGTPRFIIHYRKQRINV